MLKFCRLHPDFLTFKLKFKAVLKVKYSESNRYYGRALNMTVKLMACGKKDGNQGRSNDPSGCKICGTDP